MCGRYVLQSDLSFLQQRFKFLDAELEHRPRYNIAPTQQVLTVTNNGERRGQLMRWGLVPFWAKDLKVGYRMINAKSETLAQRPAFRAAFRKRRCLVLADGFYEWRKEGKARIPMFIHLKSNEPFALAGLWETWKSPEGDTVRSCTIITTGPNDIIAPIHNRMPVILTQESEALWLDPLTEDPSALTHLLTPAPPELMETYQVSSLVNSVKNDTPEILASSYGYES